MRGMWLLALALVCAAHAQEAPPDDLLALAMSDSFAGGSAGAGEAFDPVAMAMHDAFDPMALANANAFSSAVFFASTSGCASGASGGLGGSAGGFFAFRSAIFLAFCKRRPHTRNHRAK